MQQVAIQWSFIFWGFKATTIFLSALSDLFLSFNFRQFSSCTYTEFVHRLIHCNSQNGIFITSIMLTRSLLETS
jgi:hypothetical protein